MSDTRRALRDFQDYAEDLIRSNHRTFDTALRRFVSAFSEGTPLGVVAETLPSVDFDAWYGAGMATIRGMVGSGNLEWPDQREVRLALSVELLRKMALGDPSLLQFTHSFMWVRNNFDDNTAEFLQQIVRPFVRDFLRYAHENPAFESGLTQNPAARAERPESGDDLALFISHSAKDVKVAAALVSLFEKALKISARRIRCTSLDGYRLPAGANTTETLRAEVFDARIVVAILTPNSLESRFVLFELGARWGASRPLYPILASGTRPRDLSAPLDGLNALSAEVSDQVRQLAEDSARDLGMPLEPMASFSKEIEGVVEAATPSN